MVKYMLKTYQFKTHCKGVSSKTAKSFYQDSW